MNWQFHQPLSVVVIVVILMTSSSHDVMAVHQTKLGAANNEMGASLYRVISPHLYTPLWYPKNFVFSPLGVSSALGLAYAGASGRTRDQMTKAMHLMEFADEMEVNEAYRSLYLTLNRDRNNYTMFLATRLYGRKDFTYRREYTEHVERYHNTTIDSLDFEGNLEGSRQTINSWVAEKTRQKIKDIIPYNTMHRDTALLLVNAAYFRSYWDHPFHAEKTSSMPFRLTKWKYEYMDMMQSDGKAFGYYNAQELGCRVLELPYAREKASMIILLPNEIEGLTYVEALERTEADLPHHIAGLHGRIQKQWVNVKLPKFTLEQEVPLKQFIQRVDINDLFDYRMADLSGIGTGSNRLYVRDLMHKVYLSVGESGTDETTTSQHAYSVTGSAPQHPPPIQFTVDRPFAFYLIEKTSGNILFLGRLVHPPSGKEWVGCYDCNGGSSRLHPGGSMVGCVRVVLLAVAAALFSSVVSNKQL